MTFDKKDYNEIKEDYKNNSDNKNLGLDDLLNELYKDYKKQIEIKTYWDLVSQFSDISRELLIGAIDDECASKVEALIRFWNQKDNHNNIPISERKPIKLFIDSGGGEVESAFMIISAIQLSVTPVHTIVIGVAYSGALDILISGHKRYSYPNATMLFHEGSTQISADANKFANFALHYRRTLNRFRDLFLKRTKVSADWYREHQNDDVWMFPEDAIEYGIIDEIITTF